MAWVVRTFGISLMMASTILIINMTVCCSLESTGWVGYCVAALSLRNMRYAMAFYFCAYSFLLATTTAFGAAFIPISNSRRLLTNHDGTTRCCPSSSSASCRTSQHLSRSWRMALQQQDERTLQSSKSSYGSVVAPPPDVSNVASYVEAVRMVEYLKKDLSVSSKGAKVIVMGGGLAGLSTAKHLVDAGHVPIVLEARNLLGGKIAAWRDDDGDVSETGLHVFFGAYPNALQLFDDLGIADRLQWKAHQMYFAKPGRPTREFAVFDFPPMLPAPLNAAWAILTCTDMLTWPEKILLGIGLIPAYVFGQSYVEEQEGITVQQWLDDRGIPQSVSDQVFLALSKALGFIGPEQLSMQCVLIALNRFLQETSGSRIAFLDGNPTERLCEPLREYIESKGGVLRLNAPVRRILVNPDNEHSLAGLLLKSDEVVSGDYYVNAMPVDALKTLIPEPWRAMPYFSKLQKLRGVPVMNIHLWFDRKLSTVDNLIFSRSPLLSVYADMSETCAEYAASNSNTSMLELVLAPAAPYMTQSDEAILNLNMAELERLFPQEVRRHAIIHDSNNPTLSSSSFPQDDDQYAKVTKFTLVRTPTSVYTTVPGMEEARPTQASPISNFVCAGDFSKQKYLASMEGAILSGKLAATVIAEKWLQRSLHNDNDEEALPSLPRQLTERSPISELAGADQEDLIPDRTMYLTTQAKTVPQAIQDELACL